ncbi:MAG: TatD family hydrolase [Chloroflexota bacterium]
MFFVDAHTHLDHYSGQELPIILDQIEQMPCRVWAVSMDLESWATTQQIAAKQPQILPTFGIHPWNAHLYADRLDELDEPTAGSAHIGEIGLDFHWVEEKDRWPLQEVVFDYFLKKAAEQNKIVNLHTKGVEQLVLQKLKQFKVERAIVHWYSGDVVTFDELVTYGCYFTFGVELLHSQLIQELAQRCPADKLLTETDGPGGLEWLTGERAMLSHLDGVVDMLAQVRGEDAAELKGQIAENYKRLDLIQIN